MRMPTLWQTRISFAEMKRDPAMANKRMELLSKPFASDFYKQNHILSHFVGERVKFNGED